MLGRTEVEKAGDFRKRAVRFPQVITGPLDFEMHRNIADRPAGFPSKVCAQIPFSISLELNLPVA